MLLASGPCGLGFEFDVVAAPGLRRVRVGNSGRIQRNDRQTFGDVWNRVVDRHEVELVTSIGRMTIYLDAVADAQVLHVLNG